MTLSVKKVSGEPGINLFEGIEMKGNQGNRPAEVFGYPITDHSSAARYARENFWCPYTQRRCHKKSRLIDYPFGVCTIQHHDELYAVCPTRFEEESHSGIPRVFEDIAIHYFGDTSNVIPFAEVRLPHVGSIDFVLVRHKPMKAEIDDFVMVEFQTDSTTGTGQLVQGLQDFMAGIDIRTKKYNFGMNTYDTIKRSMTQLLNKGIVYEIWGVKGYWVIQEYIYANLVRRYGFKSEGYSPTDSTRFSLYDFDHSGNQIKLTPTRLISTTVDEVYLAMKNNPNLPDKQQFIDSLGTKLRAKLSLDLDK